MGCFRCGGRRGLDPENECAHCMGGNCDCQTPENCENPAYRFAPPLLCSQLFWELSVPFLCARVSDENLLYRPMTCSSILNYMRPTSS